MSRGLRHVHFIASWVLCSRIDNASTILVGRARKERRLMHAWSLVAHPCYSHVRRNCVLEPCCMHRRGMGEGHMDY